MQTPRTLRTGCQISLKHYGTFHCTTLPFQTHFQIKTRLETLPSENRRWHYIAKYQSAHAVRISKGSHDTMTYCLDISSPLVQSESDTFRLVDGLFYCLTRPAIYRWATTQERSIVEQMKAGIRYFDLRIAHKPSDTSDDLYFTHVIFTFSTVVEALEDIARWLDCHPKEVVILACREFEGLSEKLHEKFIFSLKKIFGSKLCPQKSSDLTLQGLWASGQQVILSYEHQTVLRHPELWPDIPYWWANQRTASGVIHYLDWQKEIGRPAGFFVSGLNLTADRRYITFHPCESLRTLTQKNQECLMDWLRDQHPGSRPDSLNIIAGDFVGSVHFCPLVIALNEKLVQVKDGGYI
ncbi:PI-PLC X domain-containing protein 1 isoform X1 [Megalops cyprinoides]|uniref:PI-PLC X domain-containing protein 1 isoform X1 n=1 Tax=Megalops cyprinoides TaxID=118141 RepID=UPI0018650ADD|nr:PI-PLC X domain-containing protein 1 isoform X1 [Megalops cyprinoides]